MRALAYNRVHRVYAVDKDTGVGPGDYTRPLFA
jgi:hypothetical protein